MAIHTEKVNGHMTKLMDNEHVETDYVCPECGGDLIVTSGLGVEVTYCKLCGWTYTDYC